MPICRTNLTAALVAAGGTVLLGVQQAPGANLGVTPGTNPVVGVTLGSGSYAPGTGGLPTWGNAGGFVGAAGGYFPTATNVLVSAGGGYPVLTTAASVPPPPYPIGSSNSFNSSGAGALLLSAVTPPSAVVDVSGYVPGPPPEVVYDFAQSSSNYASLTANTKSTGPDTYNLGAGALPGYVIAPTTTAGDSAYAGVSATVSSSGAGVTWSSSPISPTGITVGFGSQPAIISASTGAMSARNNAATSVTGRTTLLWSGGGYIPLSGSFVEFSLNGTITSGPGAPTGQIGAGPVLFAISTMNNILNGVIITGSGTNQLSLLINGLANSSSQTFANGDFADEGYTVVPDTTHRGRGYDFTMWAVSDSSAFTLSSGATLAGAATATIFGNEGTDFALNPSALPAAYSGDAQGFTYFTTPEPPAWLPLVLGGALALVARRRGRAACQGWSLAR